MQALAQWVMRGPLQASLAAVIAFALPFLFWLGAAIVALVTLRLGPRAGMMIAAWAVLPAAGWLFMGQDPAPLSVLMISLTMAWLLQATVSWERMLLGGAVAALLLGELIPRLLPELTAKLVEMGVSLYQQMNPEMAAELGEELEPMVRLMMIGTTGALNFLMALLATLLGRGWQARLFNPGGFQREFHDFRLSGPATLVLVMVMAFAPMLGANPALASLVFGVPLVVAGLALVHGLVGRRNMGRVWLVVLYASVVVLGPSLLLMLIFVAILDSWLDFRKRLSPH
ncbi:MAG: hypothetical protein R3296_03370 [Oleiphilaceae bacterium]|nr:hypothetical protein [Oleiphilaceae bacterium]